MLVECPTENCGTQLDPNDEGTSWQPPSKPVEPGAIKCPTCGQVHDFSDWKIMTAKVASQPDR